MYEAPNKFNGTLESIFAGGKNLYAIGSGGADLILKHKYELTQNIVSVIGDASVLMAGKDEEQRYGLGLSEVMIVLNLVRALVTNYPEILDVLKSLGVDLPFGAAPVNLGDALQKYSDCPALMSA